MSVWLVWDPYTESFFLDVDEDVLGSSPSCSICKRKRFGLYRSPFFLGKKEEDLLGEEFLLREIFDSRPKVRVKFPLTGREWSIIISRKHDNSIAQVLGEDLTGVFSTLLREIHRHFSRERVEHVYCFSLFNVQKSGLIYHPQLRCFSFSHKLLAPLLAKKAGDNCGLCSAIDEISRDSGEEMFFVGNRSVAFWSMYEKDTLYILSRGHYNEFGSTRDQLVESIKAFFERGAKAVLERMGYEGGYKVYFSIEFIKNNHIFGKFIIFDETSGTYDMYNRILMDRYVRPAFGMLV